MKVLNNITGLLNTVLTFVAAGILCCFLACGITSCEKESDGDIGTGSGELFPGDFSTVYDRWRLIAIGGFHISGIPPDFDYIEFTPPGFYEIVSNDRVVERGKVIKDTAKSTDDRVCGDFLPDVAFVDHLITPAKRFFTLENDTLLISNGNSYLFARWNNSTAKSPAGFHLRTGNVVVLENSEIDYYDFSAHLIYLKDNHTLLEKLYFGASLKVFADSIFIYPVVQLPVASSWMPEGAIIWGMPFFYPDYLIAIDFMSIGNTVDMRGDSRIADVLKQNNQFHEGLNCTIESIDVSAENEVRIDLLLKNEDTFDYYYMDPLKMGTGLFHYYTNGLSFWDGENYRRYSHKIDVDRPETNKAWHMEWLSLIKSGEEIPVSIVYESFDTIPPGNFQASFEFPGLGRQISKNEIQQENGRIWLGEMQLTSDITIE
jgi:hypothetical protein